MAHTRWMHSSKTQSSIIVKDAAKEYDNEGIFTYSLLHCLTQPIVVLAVCTRPLKQHQLNEISVTFYALFMYFWWTECCLTIWTEA